MSYKFYKKTDKIIISRYAGGHRVPANSDGRPIPAAHIPSVGVVSPARHAARRLSELAVERARREQDRGAEGQVGEPALRRWKLA